MNKTIIACFHEIYNKKLALLEMVREEQWEEFIELEKYYVTMFDEVFDSNIQDLDPEEKVSLRTIIKNIQENEKEMMEKLKSRIHFLKKNISSLDHSNKCSQLYNTQFMSVKFSSK